MAYDEVSVVDAGACNDDEEGAHVVLFKREAKISDGEIVDFGKALVAPTGGGGGSPTKKPSRKSPRKRSNSTRGQHWKEDRHPRVKAGSGDASGEFGPSSAQSKEKYGKGGTAKYNLPKKYKTKNKAAASLQSKLTPQQEKLLQEGNAKTAAAAAKKRQSAARSAAAHQRAQQAHARAEAGHKASLINSLSDDQRAAYRAKGRDIPKGYKWDRNNHLITREKAKLERGLPRTPKTKTSSGSSGSSSKKKTQYKMELVMGRDGKISWKNVPVGRKNHGKLTDKKKAHKKTGPANRKESWTTSRKRTDRKGSKAVSKSLAQYLYAEGSTTS